jgi:N-glycosylase/DNA lyase
MRSSPAPALSGHPSARTLQLEAAGCILASQVPHSMAVAAFERLILSGLLPCSEQPTGYQTWRLAIVAALSNPLSLSYPRRYRFPNRAAGNLSRFVALLPAAERALHPPADPRAARRELVSLRCGLGPKQASLLLRNLGLAKDLAVLDSHILSFMRLTGLLTCTRPPTNLASYETIEDRFCGFSIGFGEPLDRLDVAVWAVMRELRSSEVQWLS